MYKITIEVTEIIKEMKGKEWLCIGEKDGERKMGYTPEIEREVEVKQIIYTQLVENLDLGAVIKAINKMK